jgi:non-heme chloroperoxidase
LLRNGRIRSSDGTAIAFAEWGNPRGAEVLLVHGWLFSSLAFKRQLDGELADRCRIVAYDLRGHGDSSAPAGDYGYANGKLWADDLQCVLEATQMRHPVIAGWSLGGRVAAHYAYVYGKRNIAALVFVSTRILQPPEPVTGPDSAEPGILSDDLRTMLPITAGFIRKCTRAPLSSAEFEEFFGAAMRVSPSARRGASLWHVEYGSYFETLELPALVVHGGCDTLVLPRAAEVLAGRIPGAQLRLYRQSGHMPFWEEAAVFNADLAEFAERHWAGEAQNRI